MSMFYFHNNNENKVCVCVGGYEVNDCFFMDR